MDVRWWLRSRSLRRPRDSGRTQRSHSRWGRRFRSARNPCVILALSSVVLSDVVLYVVCLPRAESRCSFVILYRTGQITGGGLWRANFTRAARDGRPGRTGCSARKPRPVMIIAWARPACLGVLHGQEGQAIARQLCPKGGGSRERRGRRASCRSPSGLAGRPMVGCAAAPSSSR